MSHENLHAWRIGDPLKAEWLDQQRRAIERNDRNSGQYSSGAFTSTHPNSPPQVVWVRMSEVLGVTSSSSGFQNRNGTISFYNPHTGDVEGLYPVEVVTSAMWDLPLDSGDLVPCWWSSGKLIPIWNRTVRAFQTVADPIEGYPAEGSCPNTYPIKFVRLSYLESAGRQGLTATSLDPSTEPDDFVHNIREGDDAYLPEDAVGWMWQQNGQWFTHMTYAEPGCESSSSSSSSESSSSSSSTSSSSKSSSNSSSSSSSSVSSSSSSTSLSSSSQSNLSSDSSSTTGVSLSSGCDPVFPERIDDIDNYNPAIEQVLTHTIGGCLRWEDSGECA